MVTILGCSDNKKSEAYITINARIKNGSKSN